MYDIENATNDLAFAEMIERGHRDFSTLQAHEKRAFGLYLEQGIQVYGNFGKHGGRIPAGYVGFEEPLQNSMRDLLTTPGARAWWDETRGRKRLMPETISRIDKLLAETPRVSNAPTVRVGAPGRPTPERPIELHGADQRLAEFIAAISWNSHFSTLPV